MARLFDPVNNAGSNVSVLIPTSLQNNHGPLTFGVWAFLTVTSTASTTNTVFWSDGDSNVSGYLPYVGTGQAAGLNVVSIINSGQNTFVGTNNFPLNSWTYFTTTISSSGKIFQTFINNTLDVNSTWAGTLNPGAGSTSGTGLTAGANKHNGVFDGAWYGQLADFAVWNTVLSTQEINALVAGARPIFIRPGNLLHWWPLDGLQSPEPEFSGNANNGTVSANATLGTSGPPMMMFSPRQPQFLPSVTPSLAAVGGVGSMIYRVRTEGWRWKNKPGIVRQWQ